MTRHTLTPAPHVVADDCGLVPPILACPHCGSEYLHHTDITIFDCEEDGPETITIVPRGDGPRAARADETGGNPSSRRHGLAIRFYCEICSEVGVDDYIADFELTIAQHKGKTYVAWRPFKPREKTTASLSLTANIVPFRK